MRIDCGLRRDRLRRALVAGLLMISLGAVAARPALTALINPLELVAYRPGTKPPHFASTTLDARPLSMTELQGNVVIINFWASWCRECRPLMPMLEQLHSEYAARGLVIVGVNVREDAEAMRRYAEEIGLSFPLVHDSDGKIFALYGVVGLPTSFVVGRDGRAVAFAVGARKWASAPARALIEALLAEPDPRQGAR